MNKLEIDRVVKAIVDGEDKYARIAELSGVDATELVKYSELLDRAISLMNGFYKFGHENMKPAGLPPPPNLYFNMEKGLDEQSPEYYAFEAVQRNQITRERAIWTCGQLGLAEDQIETAIDNVIMPWREVNGWRSYAQLSEKGGYILQDKPPVKLKRHLDRLLQELEKASEA